MAEIPFPAWDPVLLHLGPLQLRWYAVGYLFGFIAGMSILQRLARARVFPIAPEKVPDLLFWLILGVMFGGRIGYCLFYKPELFLTWRVIAVWEGGLSFHGGLLGVVVASILWSWSQRLSAWRVLDCMALATTPGVFAVRIANFINGELYGRVTDETVPWAMRFPSDPIALNKLGIIGGMGIRDRDAALREAIESGAWERIRDQVPLRHPSQLYEALGEGLLLGLVLLVVYLATRRKPLGSGVYGGIFALGYGGVRFVVEYFRQPDAQFRDAEDPLGTVIGSFTMGQVLCAAMIAYGLAVILFRWKRREGLAET